MSSKFKIRQVGREGLYNYHKNNKQYLSEDQEINSRFNKELDKLKVNIVNNNDELFHAMNSVLNNKENVLLKETRETQSSLDDKQTSQMSSQEESNTITPIDDILSSITKDDVKRNKKKRIELNNSSTTELNKMQNINSLNTNESSQHDSEQTKFAREKSMYPHSSKYFKRAPTNTTYKNSIRVTLYNKGYEKDLF